MWGKYNELRMVWYILRPPVCPKNDGYFKRRRIRYSNFTGTKFFTEPSIRDDRKRKTSLLYENAEFSMPTEILMWLKSFSFDS